MALFLRSIRAAAPVLLVLLFACPPGPARAIAGGPTVQSRPAEGGIRFVGNRELSARDLETAAAAELADFASHHRLAAVDDAAYRMELAYREKGYAFVVVDYRLEADSVTFTVNEGPRVILTGITITGNTVFSAKELLARLGGGDGFVVPGAGGGHSFVEAKITEGMAAIRALYYREGYREVTVSGPLLSFSPDRSRVEATVVVTEGVRWTVSAVRYPAGLPDCVGEPFAAADKEFSGKPFSRRRKLLLKSRLVEALGECGYPESRVVIREESGGVPGAVVLTADIDSGPAVTIAAIKVVGNQRTGVDFIRERLALVAGEPYRESKKRQSFRNLYGTGLFAKVELSLGGEAGSTARPLLVRVEEGAARQVSGEVGWGSYELLRSRVGYEDRNLYGTGRSLRLEGGGSFKGGDLQAGVTDPWLLGSGITADLPLYFRYREEPSFTREESGGGLYLSRAMGEATTATLGYLLRRTDITAMDADAQLEGEESGYNLASLKLQGTVDSRNDIFFPTAGGKTFAALEVADAVLGSDLAFYRFTIGCRRFRELTSRLTLGFRYDTGLIIPGRNQETIPLGERFYNGGENTVRSFREGTLGATDLAGNPVGGMGYNVVSVELRRMLTDSVAASLFVDYGNLSPNRSRAQAGESAFTSSSQVVNATVKDFFSDFKPALGCGVQYLLPVGPARLDVAWNPDQHAESFGESVVVHFSIGMAF